MFLVCSWLSLKNNYIGLQELRGNLGAPLSAIVHYEKGDRSFVSCVVAKLERVNVFVGVVIEENCRASFALEFYAILLLVLHLKNFNLDIALFVHCWGSLSCFLVKVLFD